jgi:hypothetical protein
MIAEGLRERHETTPLTPLTPCETLPEILTSLEIKGIQGPNP